PRDPRHQVRAWSTSATHTQSCHHQRRSPPTGIQLRLQRNPVRAPSRAVAACGACPATEPLRERPRTLPKPAFGETDHLGTIQYVDLEGEGYMKQDPNPPIRG